MAQLTRVPPAGTAWLAQPTVPCVSLATTAPRVLHLLPLVLAAAQPDTTAPLAAPTLTDLHVHLVNTLGPEARLARCVRQAVSVLPPDCPQRCVQAPAQRDMRARQAPPTKRRQLVRLDSTLLATVACAAFATLGSMEALATRPRRCAQLGVHRATRAPRAPASAQWPCACQACTPRVARRPVPPAPLACSAPPSASPVLFVRAPARLAILVQLGP
jgi:hypothetical protein